MTDDPRTWRFGWPDRIDEQIGDHERRLLVLERKVDLLLEVTRDIAELLKGMREAIDGDDDAP